MTQQLVQTNLNLETRNLPLLQNLVVLSGDEWRRFGDFVGRTENISQTHILESLRLSDLIIVGDVDT